MSDEIYARMVYDNVPHASMLVYPEIADRLILLDGWSKTYAMTGWRLGYAVWPKDLAEHATRLAINIHSCVNAATQWAGIEALQGAAGRGRSAWSRAFDERRKVILERLNALPGFRCVRPGGAFYAFPNIAGTGYSARQLQDDLLERGRASRWSPAPASAIRARATSASPTPTRSPTSRRRSTASRASSSAEDQDAATSERRSSRCRPGARRTRAAAGRVRAARAGRRPGACREPLRALARPAGGRRALDLPGLWPVRGPGRVRALARRARPHRRSAVLRHDRAGRPARRPGMASYLNIVPDMGSHRDRPHLVRAAVAEDPGARPRRSS